METVTLVGRSNVGKSTLFNRFLGAQKSIVVSTPGVTRDRIEGVCSWVGKHFKVVDTGGIFKGEKLLLDSKVEKQVQEAIRDTHILLFVIDIKEGFTLLDEEILQWLRKHSCKKPIFLIANKADTVKDDKRVSQLYEVGLGEPIAVSALHGRGIGELLDQILEKLSHSGDEVTLPFLELSLVGRPNVGKSSILNALLGQPRVIVHEEPGTTRDSVDTRLSYEGKELVLIDTAGLRKRSKAVEPLEFYSRTRTLKAIRQSQVVILVLDALLGVLAQDKRIAGEIQEAGKGMVILANKWDKLSTGQKKDVKQFMNHVRSELYFVNYAPLLPTSALTGYGMKEILPTVLSVYESWRKTFNVQQVKQVLQEAQFLSPPPSVQGKKIRFKTILPVGESPPTFLLKTNFPAKIPGFYLQYLEGKLREAFPLNGTPVRFLVRSSQKAVRR